MQAILKTTVSAIKILEKVLKLRQQDISTAADLSVNQFTLPMKQSVVAAHTRSNCHIFFYVEIANSSSIKKFKSGLTLTDADWMYSSVHQKDPISGRPTVVSLSFYHDQILYRNPLRNYFLKNNMNWEWRGGYAITSSIPSNLDFQSKLYFGYIFRLVYTGIVFRKSLMEDYRDPNSIASIVGYSNIVQSNMIVHPTVLSVAQQQYYSGLSGITLSQSSFDSDIIGFYPCQYSQDFLSLDLYEYSVDSYSYNRLRFGLVTKLGLSVAKLSGWFVPVDDFYEYMPYKNDQYFYSNYSNCQNSRTILYSVYFSYYSQTLTYTCNLLTVSTCPSYFYYNGTLPSDPAGNIRCILRSNSYFGYNNMCSYSVRGTGKQITYLFNENETPYSFNCSGTTDKAYSGGKDITCPLNDDYLSQEDACDNCNNQGICFGETVRKCSCFEGWSGTKCEIRQTSTFELQTELPPAWDSVSIGSSSSIWDSRLLIFTGLLLQLFMAI
jgi:hypothetical protein